MPSEPLKPVVWVGDSLRVLKAFPSAVQNEVGYALFLAERGEKYIGAKPIKGLGAGVLEVVADHRSDTFRAVYTVRLADRATFSTRSRRSRSTASQRRRTKST